MTTDAYPTVLEDPSDFGADFVVEQQVTMTHARGENTFRAFLQKQGDTLTLIGLAPHGGRAFVLTQRGAGTEDVTFESAMPEELPFPPQYMLHDIHRTWFMAGSSDADGETRTETIDESGLVVERTFERRDGTPAGVIRVTYPGGLPAGAPLRARPPDEVTLDNGWFGYRATVRTLSWQQL